MAPRKTYRSVKVINKDYGNLAINDVLCPICRSVLIEPVSLPCSHGFCFSCFEGTVANANLTCPLCRVRFGSWHRVATKENKIVNEQLWLAIKKSFPKLVQNRLNGIDDNIVEETTIRLSTPGDIRKEYEEQRRKELLEIERQRIAEAKASEELILKLKEQERLEREKREEALKKDEEVARKLTEELNQKVSKMQLVTPKKSKPLDKFLVDIQKATTSEEKTKKELKPPLYFLTKPGDQLESEIKNGALTTSDDIKLAPRYFFLPVDVHKGCSHGKLVKIPAVYSKTSIIFGPLKGKTDFRPSERSAFVRLHKSPTIESTEKVSNSPLNKKGVGRKRKFLEDMPSEGAKSSFNGLKKSPQKTENIPVKANTRRSSRLLGRTAGETEKLESPPFLGFERKSSRLLGRSTGETEKMESPPFLGFGRTPGKKPDNRECGLVICNNNVVSDDKKSDQKSNEEKLRKEAQEKMDLEFARKLHEKLNRSSRNSTRNSINNLGNSCTKRRQIKLDEIIKVRSKVK